MTRPFLAGLALGALLSPFVVLGFLGLMSRGMGDE